MCVFYIGDREGWCDVFRRLCVGMILGWDFYWFGVGRGCDVFLPLEMLIVYYKQSRISVKIIPCVFFT